MWHDQAQEHEFGCFYIMTQEHFKKQNMGESLFQKHSKFQKFNEIL